MPGMHAVSSYANAFQPRLEDLQVAVVGNQGMEREPAPDVQQVEQIADVPTSSPCLVSTPMMGR